MSKTRLESLEGGDWTVPEGVSTFFNATLLLRDMASAGGILWLPIRVPDGTFVFTDMLLKAGKDKDVSKLFVSSDGPEKIISNLAVMLNQNFDIQAEKRVSCLFLREETFSWDPLAQAALQFVQSQNAKHANMSGALGCLGLLRSRNAIASSGVDTISGNGVLLSRLNEALAEKNIPVLGYAVSLLVLSTPAGIPSQLPQLLTEPHLIQAINDALFDFDESSLNLQKLIELGNKHKHILHLIREIISYRIKNEIVGSINIENIFGNFPTYKAVISGADLQAFLLGCAEYNDLWNEIDRRPFKDPSLEILYVFLGVDSLKTKAATIIKENIHTVQQNEWVAAVRTGAEPLSLVLAAANISEGMHVNSSSLSRALEELNATLLSTSDNEFCERWYKAASLLSPESKKTTFRTLRDLINGGHAIAQTVAQLIQVGENEFLYEAEFVNDADKSVRHVVLPLISYENGTECLLSFSIEFLGWIMKAEPETRIELSTRLLEEGRKSVERKEKIDALKRLWSEFLPRAELSDEAGP